MAGTPVSGATAVMRMRAGLGSVRRVTDTPPASLFRGPRDPGDAWVEAPTGERYWGRFGAAGLLAIDPGRGVLLQHRVGWSHFGGTWALPGGAMHQGETPIAGAIREAQEEAGVPDGAVSPRFTHVFDAGVWTYTTVAADVAVPFEPRITDPESLELAWVPVDEVGGYDLHPAFAAAWRGLREALPARPVLLVDAANVVGSVPDGWWRDRAGAAARLRDGLAEVRVAGVPAGELGLAHTRWFPDIEMVVEGAARAMVGRGRDHAPEQVRGSGPEHAGGDAPEQAEGDPLGQAGGPGPEHAGGDALERPEGVAQVRGAAPARVGVTAAAASGDDELVRRAVALASAGRAVTAVTSDRALRARLEEAGARVRGASWLRALLP